MHIHIRLPSFIFICCCCCLNPEKIINYFRKTKKEMKLKVFVFLFYCNSKKTTGFWHFSLKCVRFWLHKNENKNPYIICLSLDHWRHKWLNTLFWHLCFSVVSSFILLILSKILHCRANDGLLWSEVCIFPVRWAYSGWEMNDHEQKTLWYMTRLFLFIFNICH